MKRYNFKPTDLDDTGYGIDGLLTRKEWINECHRAITSQGRSFGEWQNNIIAMYKVGRLERKIYHWEIEDQLTGAKNIFSHNPVEPILFDVSGCEFNDFLFPGLGFQIPFGFSFIGAIFNGQTRFKNINTAGVMFFHGSAYGGDLVFDNIYANKIVNFNHSTINYISCFNTVNFISGVDFSYSEIIGDAIFKGVNFASADFTGVQFLGDVDFSGKTSGENNKPQYFGPSFFSGASFLGNADFSDRDFGGRMLLGLAENKATKFTVPPIFHNSKLHQDTTFLEVKFPKKIATPKVAARAYNTLRLLMNQKQATREEQMFLILELDSERQASQKGLRFLYAAYKTLSGYGFSTKRPLIILIALPMLLSALFFWTETSKSNCISIVSASCKIDPLVTSSIAKSAIIQALPPIGLDKYGDEARDFLFKDNKQQLKSSIVFVTAIQKLLSLLGWFFVVLAIRNLFKMK